MSSSVNIFDPLGIDPVGRAIGKAVGGVGRPGRPAPPPPPSKGRGQDKRVEQMEGRREKIQKRAQRASVALANEDIDVVGASARKLGRTSRNRKQVRTLG